MENIDLFLQELTKLSKKYNIVIGGCGCCGSPYLDDIKAQELIKTDLCWDNNNEQYKVNGNL